MDASTDVMSSTNNPRRLVAGAHQAVDRIADAANHAAETISEKRLRLAKVRADMLESCRVCVVDNPAISLGVAAAAGFLLRHLIRPR